MDTMGYDRWIGCDVYDNEDDKLGTVDSIYYDDVSRRPEWVVIKGGMIGTRNWVAPIAGATMHGTDEDYGLRLAYSEDTIKDAPGVDADGHLSAEEERQLYAHYGFDWASEGEGGRFGYGEDWNTDRIDQHYAVEHGEDAARRESEVVATETVTDQRVNVEQVPREVRLRKYQWTEMVPVQHEEVRVEQDAETRHA